MMYLDRGNVHLILLFCTILWDNVNLMAGGTSGYSWWQRTGGGKLAVAPCKNTISLESVWFWKEPWGTQRFGQYALLWRVLLEQRNIQTCISWICQVHAESSAWLTFIRPDIIPDCLSQPPVAQCNRAVWWWYRLKYGHVCQRTAYW